MVECTFLFALIATKAGLPTVASVRVLGMQSSRILRLPTPPPGLRTPHVDCKRDADGGGALAFVEKLWHAHPVIGLAHERAPDAREFRVDLGEQLALRGRRVDEVERAALDLHVEESGDLDAETHAQPRKSAGQLRKLQGWVDEVDGVGVAKEVDRLLDGEHVRTGRIEHLDAARRLDQVPQLPRLPRRAQQFARRTLDREHIAPHRLRLLDDDLRLRKHAPP